MLLLCGTEMLRYQAELIFLCSSEFITTQLCNVCVLLYLAELHLVENEKRTEHLGMFWPQVWPFIFMNNQS